MTREPESDDWLVGSGRRDAMVQTLHQQNGFAMTLVIVEGPENDDDDDGDRGIEDAFDRSSRFS